MEISVNSNVVGDISPNFATLELVNDPAPLNSELLRSMQDRGQAELFLSALGFNKKDAIVAQSYPVKERDSKGRPYSPAGAPLDVLWNWISHTNSTAREICSVSVTTNPADGTKKSDIKSIRVVFADDDTPRHEARTDFKIQPHVTTQTSEHKCPETGVMLGKYHYFWRVVEGELTPDELGRLQKLIAVVEDTDTSLSDASKKARLPGTIHAKGVPFMCRVIQINETAAYVKKDFEDVYGPLDIQVTKTLQSKRTMTGATAFGEIAVGGRNTELYKRASAYIGRGFSDEEVRALVHADNAERCAKPLDRAEVDSVVNSALSNDWPPNVDQFAHTDLGNSERFAVAANLRLGFNHVTKSWWYFDGVIWTEDAVGIAERLANQVVREMRIEAAGVEDHQRRESLEKHARSSESLKSRRAMLEGAKALLSLDHRKLDADHWALNCINGSLDLKTIEFEKHDPAQFHSKVAGAEFDPTAKAPLFEKFMADFTCGDHELSKYIQETVGRALTGDVSVHGFSLFFGAGRNGKNVLGKTIHRLLGSYSVILSSDFLSTASQTAYQEICDLRGARLAISNELPEMRLNEALLKALTGGDILKGKRVYQTHQEFYSTATLLCFTNHKPRIVSNSEATWSRIESIPCKFDGLANPEKLDPALEEKLTAEFSGILNWALEGLQRWQRQGRTMPSVVIAEKAEYREDQDTLGEFIADSCDVGSVESVCIPRSDLHVIYRDWATRNDLKPWSRTVFYQKIRERRGIIDKRTDMGRYFYGITFKK